MESTPINPPPEDTGPDDPWRRLRQFTRARVGIGRTGHAQTTQTILSFGLAHAQARDAVHLPLDVPGVEAALREIGLTGLPVHSAAADRDQYLRRPDLGRRLDDDSRARLCAQARPDRLYDVVFVVADGLSALAAQRSTDHFFGTVSGSGVDEVDAQLQASRHHRHALSKGVAIGLAQAAVTAAAQSRNADLQVRSTERNKFQLPTYSYPDVVLFWPVNVKRARPLKGER